MPRPKGGLGRGLDALFADVPVRISSDDGGNKKDPAEDKDSVIYIKVIFDQDAVEAYTHEDGHIKQQRLITLKCEVYGEKSQQIAIMLNALIRADYILQYLTHGGMWLYSSPSAISEVHEFINGLWYERHDLEFEFNECLEIDVPKLPDTALIVPLNVNGTQDKDIEVDKE